MKKKKGATHNTTSHLIKPQLTVWGHHCQSQTMDSIQCAIEGLGTKAPVVGLWRNQSSAVRKKSCINCCCCQWVGGAVTRESWASWIPRSQPCLSTVDKDIMLSHPSRIKWKSCLTKPSVPLRNSSWIVTLISAARCIGRPCSLMAWLMPFQWTHIPWVSSSKWESIHWMFGM